MKILPQRPALAAIAAALLLAGISCAADTPQETSDMPASTHRAIAAFAQWRIYEREYLVKHIDTSGAADRLTGVHYAFANVSEDGRCFETNAEEGDAWADYQRPFAARESVNGVADRPGQALSGNFNQLRKLKAKHPHLQIVMSIGGWSQSTYFSNAARTAESRRAFAASCIELFLAGNLPRLDNQPEGGPGVAFAIFDGIDIDWEWPGSEGEVGNVVRPEDRENFTLLLAEFRRQLDEFGRTAGRHYTLSAFLPAADEQIRAGYEPGKIFTYLDYASVNGFDLHGPWESQTNHHAQLRSPDGDPDPERLSAEEALNTWIRRGAPPEKLVLAVPAFGRGWQGVGPDNNGLYQPVDGPAPGRYEPGAEDYRILAKRPGPRFQDGESVAQWLYDGDQWWSYDDPEVMQRKAAYVRERGLAGVIMWSLDGDDESASLVAAIHAGLLSTE